MLPILALLMNKDKSRCDPLVTPLWLVLLVGGSLVGSALILAYIYIAWSLG